MPKNPNAIVLICSVCQKVHYRVYNEDLGFGICNECGSKLTKRNNLFDKRISTQIKHISLER